MLGTSTSKRLLKITVIAAYSANLSSAFTNSFPSHPSLGVTTIPKKNDKYLRMSQEGAEPIEQTTIARLEKGLTEMNRRDRRDFFNADKWVQHRASDRFLENLIRIPFSRVVWMIFKEVSIISLISWLLVAYNHLFVLGYTDLFEGTYYPPITDMQFPLLTLPKEPFILSSPALSFMLGEHL